MYKLFVTTMLGLCVGYNANSQITYGKEDCGELFNNWIFLLDEAKPGVGESLETKRMESFNRWIAAAKKDIAEARFNVLRKTETENLYLKSVINVLHNSRGAIFGNGFSASVKYKDDISTTAGPFFENINAAGSVTQNLVQALNFPFRVFSIDDEIRESKTQGMFMLFDINYEGENFETVDLNSFYKYLLDLVEFGRETPMDKDFRLFYKANYKLFGLYTGLDAPNWDETENVKKYLNFFANELLYALGRYSEYLINEKKRQSPITLAPYKGTMGDNRYAPDYYKKLLGRSYKGSIEKIIQHVNQLKNNCAPASLQQAGKVKIETAIQPIPQQENNPIPVPRNSIKPGLGRLLIIQKNAAGKYYRDEIANLHYTEGTKGWYAGRYTNQYDDLNPGHYILRCHRPASDSMLVDIVPGATKVVSLPEKGTMSARLIDTYGKVQQVRTFRIEILKQNKANSYKTDTLFFDLRNGDAPPREMNAGLYRVGIHLPPKYYPFMVYAEEPVEVQEHNNTEVTISGFGSLSVKTRDGNGKSKVIRTDIFTSERNSKTREYTWLVRSDSQDTLYIRPGRYKVVIDYPLAITRDIEIVSGKHLMEPVDHLGSLLVTNGNTTTEWIEITDETNQKKTSVRNNTSIDVETDRTYTVKVIPLNNGTPKYFREVKVQPGMTTTVNWKN
ncbi:MAG: hypothetical protein V4722_09385 [Bacteroidota bacterium]